MATRTAIYDLYADEYASMDQTETVTIVPIGNDSPIENVTAKKANTSKRRTGGQPAFIETSSIVWIVFDTTLGEDNEMHERYKIQDESGNVWSVNNVSEQRFGTQWRCECTPDRK